MNADTTTRPSTTLVQPTRRRCHKGVVAITAALLTWVPHASAQVVPRANCTEAELAAKETDYDKVIEQQIANRDELVALDFIANPSDFVITAGRSKILNALPGVNGGSPSDRWTRIRVLLLKLIDDIDESDPLGIADTRVSGGRTLTIVRIEAMDRAVERIVASTPPADRERDRKSFKDIISQVTLKMTAGRQEETRISVPSGAAARRDQLAARAKALSAEIDAIQACLKKNPGKSDPPPRSGEVATRLNQVNVKAEPGSSPVGGWAFDELNRSARWDALPGAAVLYTTPFSLDLDPKGDSVKLAVRVVPNLDRPQLTGSIEARAIVNGKAGEKFVTVIASGSGKVESKVLPIKLEGLRVGDTVVIVLVLSAGDIGAKPMLSSAQVSYTYLAK